MIAVRAHCLRDHQSGVTLIEMMIVLAVIGIATGAATLGLASVARDNRAETEALRMASRINLAMDDALIEGAARVVMWDREGYSILPVAAENLAEEVAAARHDFDASVTLQRADGTTSPVVMADDGTSPPVTLILRGSGTVWDVSFTGLVANVAAGTVP
jgi:general secretion pathway protein H